MFIKQANRNIWKPIGRGNKVQQPVALGHLVDPDSKPAASFKKHIQIVYFKTHMLDLWTRVIRVMAATVIQSAIVH